MNCFFVALQMYLHKITALRQKLSGEPCLDLVIFDTFKGSCIKISMISHKLLFHIWIMFNFDQKVTDFLIRVSRTCLNDSEVDSISDSTSTGPGPGIPSSLLSTSSKWQSSRRSWSKVSSLIIKISEGLFTWSVAWNSISDWLIPIPRYNRVNNPSYNSCNIQNTAYSGGEVFDLFDNRSSMYNLEILWTWVFVPHSNWSFEYQFLREDRQQMMKWSY